MRETRFWTWHMAAGVVIFFLLGMHMLIMHTGLLGHVYAPFAGEAVSRENSQFRDSRLTFTVSYIFLLGFALYHGLYGLRTILFELTLRPAVEKVVRAVLVLLGVGLFGLGVWAAIGARTMAAVGARG